MARYYNDGHCSHCELQGDSGVCKACASCMRFHAVMKLFSLDYEYVKSTPGFRGRKIVNECE